MSYHEEGELDYLLKHMDTHITWNEKRQQQLRNQVLLKVKQQDQAEPLNKNHWLKKMVPLFAFIFLIGIGATLFFSEVGEQSFSSSEIKSDEIGVTQGNHSSGEFPFTITKENEDKMEEIKASGFDLRLPTYTSEKQTEISKSSLVLRNESVSTSFYYEEERLFRFTQESFGDADIYMPAMVYRK